MPTTGHNVKLTLVIFPKKKEDLDSDQSLSDRAVFPGIKIGVFDVELGFDGQKIVDKAIGSPVLPCLVVKELIKSSTTIPSRDEFLYALSSTLRLAVSPEIKQNERTLSAAWAAIKEKGECQLSKESAPIYWPEYVIVQQQRGRNYFI